jgi:CheY-like chemotaxis protein
MSRILLVEGNEDDIGLTLIAFRRQQLANELVIARDGQEALEILHGTPSMPAQPLPVVVLLDLKLPRRDRFEVLDAIRAYSHTRLLPVVLTSSAQERDRLKTSRLGANSYIVKPLDFEQFLEAARQIGMYWLMLNTAPPNPEGERPCACCSLRIRKHDAELTITALERDGLAFEKRLVATRDEYLRALDEGGWSAVISDCRLPGFSSIEALRLLRERDGRRLPHRRAGQ